MWHRCFSLIGIAWLMHGYVNSLDNFAHIGGFVAGLISGIIFFPIPSHTRTSTIILWVIRLVLLAGLAGMFYGMINLFYSGRSSEDVSVLLLPMMASMLMDY